MVHLFGNLIDIPRNGSTTMLLALGMTAIYPFVRFRGMFGLGFLGTLFWLQDRPMAGLAVALSGEMVESLSM